MSTLVINVYLPSIAAAGKATPAACQDALQAVDAVYRAQEKRLWATEGASGGPKWKELGEPYRKMKERSRAAWRSAMRAKIAKIRKANNRKRLTYKLPMSTKILQRYGAMRSAFSTDGQGHVARWYIGSKGAKIQVGAQGEPWWFYHADGVPPQPKRDPQQRTQEQVNEMREAAARAFTPHLVAAIKAAVRSTVPFSGGPSA